MSARLGGGTWGCSCSWAADACMAAARCSWAAPLRCTARPTSPPAARCPTPLLRRAQPGNTAAFNATQTQIKAWIRQWVVEGPPHWRY